MGSKRNRKAEEVYALAPDQLEQALQEAHRQLFTLRFQHATRQLENTSQLRQVRRQIARLRTVQRQRQLAAAEG
jgi:large subunit ribosomal protein L29